MSEPVIGYRSIITPTNVSAFPVVDGFPAAAMANGMTYDRWRGVGAMTRLYIDAGVPVSCDYLGIAAHNYGSSQAVVRVCTATGPGGAGTVQRYFGIIANNAPKLVLFPSASSRYWFVEVTPSLGSPNYTEAGAIYLGERLTFERCIMKSHAPAPLNRQTNYYDATSESGQFLGRSIMRRGFVTDVSPDLMTAAWVRSEFQPFVKAARLAPYFFAWNPGDYPDEVVFGRTSDDIGAEYTGDRDRMKASWKIEGLGWDD